MGKLDDESTTYTEEVKILQEKHEQDLKEAKSKIDEFAKNNKKIEDKIKVSDLELIDINAQTERYSKSADQ